MLPQFQQFYFLILVHGLQKVEIDKVELNLKRILEAVILLIFSSDNDYVYYCRRSNCRDFYDNKLLEQKK